MNPSTILTWLAAALATIVVASLAYLQLPYHPRRTQKLLKAWLSPMTLVAYLLVIVAAFLGGMGQ